jgi:hypothetical protein
MIDVTDLDARAARDKRERWKLGDSPMPPEQRSTWRAVVRVIASAPAKSSARVRSPGDGLRCGHAVSRSPAARAGPTVVTPSRRCVLAWVLSLGLALATGATVSQTVATVRMPLPSDIQSEVTAAAVRTFYAAANSVLATGDAAALAAAVPADFIDHAGLPGATPDRAGLARYLAALHDVAPGARLTVADLTAVGDRAMARVEVLGADEGTFLGIPLPGRLATWGRVDTLRVDGGQVRERWGDGAGLVSFESRGRLPLGNHLPILAGVALERIDLRPGDHTTPPPMESRLISVEAGTLTVAIEQASIGRAWVAAADGRTRAVAPGATTTLSGGDLLALAAPIRYDLRNDGTEPATALVTAVFPPDLPARSRSSSPSFDGRHGPPWPPNVVVQALTGAVVAELPIGALAAGLGRVTLAPGAQLKDFVASAKVVLAVESGALDFDAAAGAAWVRRGADGTTMAMSTGMLAPGDGALLPVDDIMTLRNPGEAPTVVVVFAIAADDLAVVD